MEKRFYPKRCTRSSAKTVASIEHVFTEILVRVPAKTLVRFKCVSKHWFSLISDPQFCHHHTLRNPNTPVSASFCDRYPRIFCSVPIDFHHIRQTVSITTSNDDNQNPSGLGLSTWNSINFNHRLSSGPLPFNPLKFAENQYDDDAKIIQSCKGLFLCRLVHSASLKPPYFIFNPTTNQFSTLYPPPATAITTAASGQQVEHYILSIALAFDPSKSPHYNVVCLKTVDGSKDIDIDGTIYHILIYSSETQTWRTLDASFKKKFFGFYGSAVYWNGAIHWLSMFGDVAYFHIDEECDGFVDIPPHFNNNYAYSTCRYFNESYDGRHLHLIEIYHPCITKFEVLEMGKDYSGWFVKYRVDLGPICLRNMSDRFVVLFLYQDENEEEDSSSLLLHTPGKLISYNLKNKTYKSLELTPKDGVNDTLLRVGVSNFPYMESLACV